MNEFAPILASLISSISRAGLNVVDRRQFQDNRTCPALIGYWNNYLPVCLIAPLVILSPASRIFIKILFSLEIIFLSLLIQCVAYSFSFAFKSFRVTDMAVLTKIADMTVPLVLLLFGFRLIPFELFVLLPAIITLFIFCAGRSVVIKSRKAILVLVSALTIQGTYSFFVGINSIIGSSIWDLLSASFVVLLWRLIFSGALVVYKGQISAIYKFPMSVISYKRFCFRGILTLITQISFVFAIESNNLMSVWPILNATGLFGAVFAYLFLSEKLAVKDLIFIALAFCISAVLVFHSNYE